VITVPIPLLGGPGDGAVVNVTGRPLPAFVCWSRATDEDEPTVTQHQFLPAVTAVYALDRRALRYVWRRVPTGG
jgi:hypothetical protein